jgi:type IV secretory pathway VirB3-like protein
MSSRDPLFGGMTRPPTLWGGVPLDAAIAIILFVVVIALPFKKIGFFLLAVPLYAIASILCKDDPRKFRYLMLAAKTRWRGLNKKLWRYSAYAPIKYRKRQ